MLEMKECKRDNLCVDCDDERCLHAGQAIADCPKYHCDNPNGIQECDKCDFLKEFQDTMRNEGVKKIDDFIIVKSDEDLPKKYYDETGHVYLCVTASGKTLVCKYRKTGDLAPRWENASNWRDSLGGVVAYRRIRLPEEVIDLCVGNGVVKKTVDYLEGMR